ncbi:MAG: phosphatidate cytidylyltransferase, partial [Bacteroidota bacterium]
GQISFFALFSLIIIGSLWEFYNLSNLKNKNPQKWLGLSVGLLTFVIAFFHARNTLPATWFILIFFSFFIFAIVEIFRKQANPANAFTSITGVIYIAGTLSTANYLVFNQSSHNAFSYQFELILGIFIIIWANDTMAYLIGKKTGKHKLMKRVSPKKTWEGTLAGLVFACITSTILSIFLIPLSTIEAGILGILISIAANLGDLFESAMKRNTGKKDSGKLLPGHGGVLDRFDAALFAIPFSFFYLNYFV